MIHIKQRVVFVCDWVGGPKGRVRGCAYSDDLETTSLRDPVKFIKTAERAARKAGWHLGKCQLCPEHNTLANRKKTFAQPDKGSAAWLMRKIRS